MSEELLKEEKLENETKDSAPANKSEDKVEKKDDCAPKAEQEGVNDKTEEEKPTTLSSEPFKERIIVVTSGKGGVGKTTSSAALAAGLAMKGHKTAVIDFDVGLRNLDLIMGCERRVVYDLINVIQGDAKLNQALIKDRRLENLYILPASQTKDKDALNLEGVEKIFRSLDEMGF